MITALTIAGGSSLPVTVHVPLLAPDLQAAIADAMPASYDLAEPDPDARPLVIAGRPPSAEILIRAAAALDRMDREIGTATADRVAAWMAPLLPMIPRAPGQAEAAAFALGIAFAAHDMPVSAFSVEAQREAIRRWKWWPAGAEVIALLAEHAAPWFAQRRALRAVIAAGKARAERPEGHERQPPTDAEREAVRRTVVEHVAYVAGRQAEPPAGAPAPRQPKPVPPDVLAAIRARGIVKPGVP